MIARAKINAALLFVGLGVAGCSAAQSAACHCPKPVAYDDETLKKISQALRALPADNVLLQAMEDYENERDDLRFCQ
ncbi:MAG TPA: hypothetical protein VE687_21550 [Stellaceae bacterium]|jgi:UDP-N-acetylmuramoylalanine-D-glutamate ligase|nr:hypothetical protein [Stellaceae bacterium]